MPSNNCKYTPEFREETARYIIESGRSATGMAEEIGIDKNTVCSWVREYRKEERPAELRGRERDQAEHEPGGMPFRQRVFGKLFCDCEKGVPVSEEMCYNRRNEERHL